MRKWGIAIVLAIFCLLCPVTIQAAQADEQVTDEQNSINEDVVESIASSKGVSQEEITELAEEDPEYYRVQQREAQEETNASSSSAIKTMAGNSIFDSKTYYHNSKFSNYTITQGIDVSYWDTITSWSKVKNAGVDFTIVRVGYRSYGSGGLYSDRDYQKNLQGAANAGLKVGAYIFSQATTVKEAEAEANFLLARIANYKITGPVVLDYEYAAEGVGKLYKAHLTRTQATNVCLAFCKVVKEAGYTPMVYANKSMFTDKLYASQIANEAEIWLAHYTTRTSYSGTYDYWQFSESGHVPGISTRVDCNFHYEKKVSNKEQDDGDKVESTPVTVNLSKTEITAIADKTYTGKEVKPSVTIKYAGKTLTKNKDYTLSYKNNINPGKATVTITGMGTYTGTVKKTFNIVVGKVTGFKQSAVTTTSMTLKWSKLENITGYEVTYSAKNGSSPVKKTVDASKTSYKITGLKKSYEYVCTIRAYQTTDGKKTYGNTVSLNVVTKGSQSKVMVKLWAGLRTQPETSAKKLVKVPPKTVLTPICAIQSSIGKTWYKVSYTKNNKTYTGYIISTTTTKTLKAKVKTKGLNIRKTASASGTKVVAIAKDKQVTVEKSVYNNKTGVTWLYVSVKKDGKTYKGYCNSKYLSI